jgi:LysM repeat protein
MDERRNFEQSTEAALKYLKALREMFGSWTLAMAAYNCGESRLKKEIARQKENNYYRLNLPLETERYIFRIAAAKLIMQDPGAYGYALPDERVYKPIACDKVQVHVRAPAPIADVARSLGTYYKIIKELNPQIRGYSFPAGRYTVLVPAGLGTKLTAALKKHGRKGSHRTAGADDGRYVVQPGDTLTHVSQRTGVPVATLKDLNGLKSSVIRVGQKLRLRP